MKSLKMIYLAVLLLIASAIFAPQTVTAHTLFGSTCPYTNPTPTPVCCPNPTPTPTPANRPPIADFTFSPISPKVGDVVYFTDRSSDSDGYIREWFWDFGDGVTTYGQGTSHMYGRSGTFTITLRVTDNLGLQASTTRTITVGSGQTRPVAEFSFYPSNPRINEEIEFDASSSYDPDGRIVEYRWRYDDGTSKTTSSTRVFHTFDARRTYSVTLTITDNDGLTTSQTRDIAVGNGRSRQDEPFASFTFYPSEAEVEEIVRFTDYSTDSDGRIDRWRWDFGDGQISTDRNPSHSYSREGTFTISLRVTDDDSLSDSESRTIRVRPGICSVTLSSLDYTRNSMEGEKAYAKVKLMNSGSRQTINLRFYLDNAIKGTLTATMASGQEDEKSFNFIPAAGSHEIRFEADSGCGARDSIRATVTTLSKGIQVSEPYFPSDIQPKLQPSDFRVEVSPKTQAIPIGKSGVFVISITSPSAAAMKFTISASGVPSDWLGYNTVETFSGKKDSFLYVTGKEPGNYNIKITVRSEDSRQMDETVSIFVSPQAQQAGIATGLIGLGDNLIAISLLLLVLGVLILLLIFGFVYLRKRRIEEVEIAGEGLEEDSG
ncbi:MAG: PKD domain-containing protein [Candidatus Aenigmarchaeota archaeon]|nr:PKD domain-containing protein [Candidatus Aenigmarchaeota archaeon]